MSLEYTENTPKILIDFLTFTVKVWDLMTDLKSTDFEENPFWFVPDERKLTDSLVEAFRLGGGDVDFQMQRARQGYSLLFTNGGITYAYGGCDNVMVQFSGTGCRFFESLNPGLSWYQYFWQLKAEFATLHVSRLDVACDTFGMLDMDVIQKYSLNHKFVSIWRKGKVKKGFLDDHEKTVIFGSKDSDFLLRIYDKTAERLENVTPDISVPDGWTRCEFQYRNDRAGGFIQKWLECQNIGTVYYGVMFDYLRFYRKYDGKNADRMVMTSWWQKFLGDAQRIKITYEGGLEYNLERLSKYVFKQAGSSIKTFLAVHDGDLSSLLNGIEACKYNPRQEQLIELQKNLLATAEHVVLPGEKE